MIGLPINLFNEGQMRLLTTLFICSCFRVEDEKVLTGIKITLIFGKEGKGALGRLPEKSKMGHLLWHHVSVQIQLHLLCTGINIHPNGTMHLRKR